MDIESKTELDPAQQIKESLDKYKPIHGSVSSRCWPSVMYMNLSSEVVTMKGGDLCLQFFYSSFAELMFPTWCHGSQASMWYPQFLSYMICPQRTVFLNLLRAYNTQKEPHQDANTLRKCKTYFIDKLILEEHKEMFENWSTESSKNKFNYSSVQPHSHFLDVSYDDINRYLISC